MTENGVELGEMNSDLVPAPVPYAVVLPPGYEGGGPFPLCLSLHGASVSRDMLVELATPLGNWMQEGSIEPMVVASASTGEMTYYYDDPKGAKWESFVFRDFLAHLRKHYNVREDRRSTLITGVSMGGHGSLKIAFAHPDIFAAVAALEPAIEPGFTSDEPPPRSRFYYPGGGPDEMIGASRDPTIFAANSPAARLRNNADAVRESGLAIYLEVGDDDALCLHDGAEFLHRVLWDHDVPHEYRLIRNADHIGPTLPGRLHEAFRWLSEVLRAPDSPARDGPISEAERKWMAWAGRGFQGEAPPPVDMHSDSAIRMIRAQFAPAREAAAQADPTTRRRYGVMPLSH